MAIVAKINTTTGIGRATIAQPGNSTIVSQNFKPKPNIALGEVTDVSTSGVQDGYTLIFNSDTGKYEAKAATDLTGTITIITGGTF